MMRLDELRRFVVDGLLKVEGQGSDSGLGIETLYIYLLALCAGNNNNATVMVAIVYMLRQYLA